MVSKSSKKSLRRFPKRDGEDAPKTVRTAGCRCPPRERLERSPSLSAVETEEHGNGEDGTLQSEVVVGILGAFLKITSQELARST